MSLHLLDCLYGSWGGLSLTLVRFLSHRIHRFNRTFLVHAFVHWKFFLSQSAQSSRSFLAHISSPQNASGIQRTQSASANVGCKVLWVLPPARALWNTVCSVHLCSSVRNRTHPPCEKERLRFAGEFLLSRRIFLSLTELTDLTELFGIHFESTERLRHTENTERFS